MIRKTIKLFLFLMTPVTLDACLERPYPEFPVSEVEGYRPVYGEASQIPIELQQPRDLTKPGKVYLYGKYLLVNEPLQGIHVFDNENPEDPIPLGFLRVLGNIDMAVRNNILYIDHLGDLVALDVSDWNVIKELSRVPIMESSFLPPDDKRYFECVDPEKGKVIGWEKATLKNPKCYK